MTIVALTTDFGLDDPFVGLMHARVLACCPQASLVDLTHQLPAYGVAAASFWIERCYRHFPPGAIHVVVVDPGVGSSRRILCVRCHGQLFLAPDNGVLGGIAREPTAEVIAVESRVLAQLGLDPVPATFHGRDIFAPLAGWLAAGRIIPSELGVPVTDWIEAPLPAVHTRAGSTHGEVIIVDRFGNCISNLDESLIASCEEASVSFGGHRLPLVRTYSDADRGSLVVLINAFGVLEAACVEGRADTRLGLAPGSPVVLTPRNC